MGSSVKPGKFFNYGVTGRKNMYFFGFQILKWHLGWDTLHLHIKPSLYVCRRVQGSQTFKQNSVILIYSCFIRFYNLGFFGSRGVGQVGGGYLG